MTAEVKLIGRFRKIQRKTKEDIAYEETQRIINPDYDREQEELREFSYEPMVIDMFKVVDYMKLDEEHTQATMGYGVYYIFKMNFDLFAALKKEMTRQDVVDGTNLTLETL